MRSEKEHPASGSACAVLGAPQTVIGRTVLASSSVPFARTGFLGYNKDCETGREAPGWHAFWDALRQRMMLETAPTEISDTDLLLRTAQQDRSAFSQLYDRLAGVMFATATRILNDPKEAEDVLQDVFLQIWNRANEFNPLMGKPLGWALTLTRNKAIDRLRASQRRNQLVEAMVNQEDAIPASSPLREPVETKEQAASIQSALSSLPADQRQAIELAFFGGLTQMEIAEKLQVPLGTIKARIRRGMLKLRENLKQEVET